MGAITPQIMWAKVIKRLEIFKKHSQIHAGTFLSSSQAAQV